MPKTRVCPKCHYRNIVVHCGFCLQCGNDLPPLDPPPGDAETAQPTPPAAAGSRHDLRTRKLDRAIRLVASQAGFALRTADRRWQVGVRLRGGRRQHVLLALGEKDREGEEMLRFLTVCGPASAPHALALLKFNGRSPYCSFAVRTVGKHEAFVATATLPADCADREIIRKTLLSIAHHADALERKILAGRDQH